MLVNTNRMQYVLAGGPSMPNRASVQGKRLAVSRLGTSSHLATRFIVKQLGLDPDRDVDYIQVGNTPERLSALLAGNVDGSILSVDEAALLGELPSMQIVVDMTQENIPYCGNGLVALRKYLQEQPDTVRRLTKAFATAMARFKQDQVAGVDAVGRFLGETDPEKAERIWAIRARMFPEKPYPEPQGVQFVMDEVAQADERVRAFSAEQLIDPRWVRELDESGYLDRLYNTTSR
jgi:NitT/TauT family transport system substrate-binding protein